MVEAALAPEQQRQAMQAMMKREFGDKKLLTKGEEARRGRLGDGGGNGLGEALGEVDRARRVRGRR